MELTTSQAKTVELIMELDLKAQEFKMLCEKLEDLKAKISNPNAPEFAELLKEFEKKSAEIKAIKQQLAKLNESNN